MNCCFLGMEDPEEQLGEELEVCYGRSRRIWVGDSDNCFNLTIEFGVNPRALQLFSDVTSAFCARNDIVARWHNAEDTPPPFFPLHQPAKQMQWGLTPPDSKGAGISKKYPCTCRKFRQDPNLGLAWALGKRWLSPRHFVSVWNSKV